VNERVRVLLLEVPRLLRDIIEHSVNAAGGCEVLTELEPCRNGIAAAQPDIVILGLASGSDATLIPALFARWPDAQVLTVTNDGSEAAAYELKVDRRVLGPMGPRELVGALHRAALRRRRH
jgi:DNA-binding NarL/FixJ family response regulator